MVRAMKTKVGNPLRKLVLIKLADNASDSGECWPSVPYIAEQCEISVRSVQSHIQQLAKDGLLRIETRRTENGLNRSNVYHLALNGTGAGFAPRGESAAPRGESAAPVNGANPAPRICNSFEPVKESVNEPLKNTGTSADASMPSPPAKQEYSPEFETAWLAYPKRAGGNPKHSAYKAWSARLKEGETPEIMLEGVKRYSAFVIATGKSGTEYVKQAATFFGPDKHFKESWLTPLNSGGGRSSTQHTGFSSRDYGESNIPSWAKGAKP